MKTKKNIFYSLTAFLTAGALSIASMGSVVAAQTQTQNSHVGHTSNTDSFGELNENELEMAFKIIESIPENALENEQAFEQWKSKNLFVGQSRASIGACAWGITKALAANIFVFSKVAKLKTVIKAVAARKL